MNKRLIIINIIGLVFLQWNSLAQNYTRLTIPEVPGQRAAGITAADLDNDGFTDLVVTGLTGQPETITNSLYFNQGDGSFVKADINDLTPLFSAKVLVGDYNGDGLMDLVYSGTGENGTIFELWRNLGNRAFEKTDQEFPAIDAGVDGNLDFADVDNDNDLDLLVSGFIQNPDNSFSEITRLFENVEGSFEIMFSPTGRESALGDYDNDGDLDLVTNGFSGFGFYENMGGGTFGDQQSLPFGIIAAKMRWFDYDNDGYNDLFVSGRIGDDNVNAILVNNRNPQTRFQMLDNLNMTYLIGGEALIRDFNNDGIWDILLDGIDENGLGTFVAYEGTGTGYVASQSLVPPADHAGQNINGLAPMDIDNDGDLDLFYHVFNINQLPWFFATYLLRNDGGSNSFEANTAPFSPENLNVDADLPEEIRQPAVLLTWDHTQDAETPPVSLTSNIWISNEAGDGFFKSPSARLETGDRYLSSPGHNGFSESFLFQAPDNDAIYYWRVQSVDQNLRGSAFSEAQRFAVATPYIVDFYLMPVIGGFRMSWEDLPNEFEYIILRDDLNNDDPFEEIAVLEMNTTEYQDLNVEDGLYRYNFVARNNVGSGSQFTSEVAVGVPQAPSDLMMEYGPNFQRLTWKDNSTNEAEFFVQAGSADGENFETVERVFRNITRSSAFQYEKDTLFKIKVIASNSRTQRPSEAIDFVVGTPARPSGFRISNVLEHQLNLNWVDESINEQQFEIQRRVGEGTSFEPYATVERNQTSFRDRDLTVGEVYTYRIRATNIRGESIWSTVASAITSTEEEARLNGLTLMQNPVNNELTFRLNNAYIGPVQLEVLSTHGDLLPYDPVNKNATDQSFQLDVARLGAGVHVLRIQLGPTRIAAKFIKE